MDFIHNARRMIAEYEDYNVLPSEIYTVWSCKILQNRKAIFSHDVFDGRLYEVTYNGNDKEYYIDVYTKKINFKEKDVI